MVSLLRPLRLACNSPKLTKCKTRPNLRRLFSANINIHGTRYISLSANTSTKNRIFTPNDFSFPSIYSYYTQNLSVLNSKIGDEDFTKTLVHFKSIPNTNSATVLPKSGSFVHLKSTEHTFENNFGIILNDLNFSLSKYSLYKVLLPNGEIIESDLDQVLFVIPDFIKRDLMKKSLISDQVLPLEILHHLTYTLNVFLLFFTKISNLILSKDLIRTIYLKDAFFNYQSSLSLLDFSQSMYNVSRSLRNHLNIKLNPLGSHALLLASHFLIYNDPIHFRFLESKKSTIFNVMNPLNQLTTKYFKNPILLAENLENIYVQPNELIIKSYSDILKKSNEFQIYNILKSDENFKRLIILIRYSIIYPNEKLLEKLSNIIPIEGTINSQSLHDFLSKIGIFDNETNVLLSSGIYGLNMYDPTDLSLMVRNVDELQYSLNKGIPVDKLPKRLQGYQPLKQLGADEDVRETKFSNNSYSDSFLKVIQDSKLKIWPHVKVKNRRILYKLTDTIAFSVDQESLTNYRFNIFIPIPIQSPNENITIQEPIQADNLKTFPKLKKFNHSLRTNQPCIKLSFNHNLIDSNSLTSPVIKVGLDMFRKIENVDEGWFQSRNASNLKGSQKKMNCWLALNKLLNLLIEKEKSRIKLGYLKIFDENTRSIGNDICDDESASKDKSWILKNLKLLIDENLSRFCLDKGINVVHRSIVENISNSIDYRVFKKFKIFKWYANSYDTFNFQLNSNPNDLTAYVGCLSFLTDCKYSIGGGIKNEYLPLGLKYYSSFTSLNYIETHLNQWQLFRYLLVESFGIIEDDHKVKWDPSKLDKVTNQHFHKCLSQSEGYIELMNRKNRFEILEKIQQDISGGTNKGYSLMRCIITKITKERIIGYLCDFDIEVEIKIGMHDDKKERVTIGDRLICSEVVCVNPYEDSIVVK